MFLAGRPTVLMIQNSGFGNLVNPLTSLCMIYKIPVLIFMSGRAYGVPDEPQHEVIGKKMAAALDALGVKYQDMPENLEAFHDALDAAIHFMRDKKSPFFFLVRKGTLDDYLPQTKPKINYPMKRIEAIQAIAQSLKGDEFVVATTGKPSRELFSVHDRKNNFYMQGSMGHAASIGLGAALAKPDKKVVVLDGDGAVLMHLGILSSVGFYKPKNFYHLVLDNEAYETTGNQDTTSPGTDFKAIARACGYRRAEEVSSREELLLRLKEILTNEGPAFLRIKINRLVSDSVPRISSKHSSEEIAMNFMAELSR
jgi:phosphonopyruvate decarboxylase